MKQEPKVEKGTLCAFLDFCANDSFQTVRQPWFFCVFEFGEYFVEAGAQVLLAQVEVGEFTGEEVEGQLEAGAVLEVGEPEAGAVLEPDPLQEEAIAEEGDQMQLLEIKEIKWVPHRHNLHNVSPKTSHQTGPFSK